MSAVVSTVLPRAVLMSIAPGFILTIASPSSRCAPGPGAWQSLWDSVPAVAGRRCTATLFVSTATTTSSAGHRQRSENRPESIEAQLRVGKQ